ncbi:MAG TPA: class I SAM-dependent methyltransferase [Trueperaceae bacterium]
MSDAELAKYYEVDHDEAQRLRRGPGQLEYARTVELLSRFLPSPPAKVIDVGGGTGVYSGWLAGKGYEVELVDPVPSHVDAARDEGSFASMVGDARALDAPDDSFDAALLLGPLYHLRSKADRISALKEARRVVRSGGFVCVAFISRSSVFFDAFLNDWAQNRGALEMMADVARNGLTERRSGFGAVSYFHSTEEARFELVESGLTVVQLVGIEGPAWLSCEFDARWQDAAWQEVALAAARAAEADSELTNSSAHLLGLCRNP